MPILKNVLGIDLGSHSVKAVEFRQTLRGLEAVRLCSIPRADETPLAELVKRFLSLHRLSTDHVVSALPGDRLSTRRLSFPFRERRRLAQAVPFEVAADLPFDLDDFLVDWEVAKEDRGGAEVVATLAPRAEVSERIESLGEAGCPPRTLEAEGLVLANLSAVFDLPGTRLLLDLGHRKSTACLLLDGRAAFARTVPLGGLELTRSLARDRGLERADAERAKCEEGVFGAARNAAGPQTEQVLDRLAREILRTLGAAEPLLGAPAGEVVSELTLFGGTAQLDGIDRYLSERTGLPAARLGLPVEDQAGGLAAGGSPVLFAPAIALGLRGTARAKTRMNFRQDEFAVRVDLRRFRRDFRWTGTLAAVVAVLAMVSFGTAGALDSRRADAIEAQVARLYGDAFPGRAVPANPLSALSEAVRSANERAEFLGVYRGNLSALDLLAEISQRVPADLEIVLEELTIDRQVVRMRVYAKSFEAADRLRAELAKFPPFAATRIGSIETDRKTGGKRFDVTISLGTREERA